MSKKSTPENKDKGNIYDKIFKENARQIFMPLIERQLGIKIVSYEALPEKIQKTNERESDFLYKVSTNLKDHFLLHIEFQTDNDPKMLKRMSAYHGLSYQEYGLRVEHIVIYLGNRKPSMKTQLEQDKIFKGFELINLYNFNPQDFLSSNVPEIILLTLFTNFKNERKEAILRLIIKRLKECVKYEKDIKRYIEQLFVLSRIRKLESLTSKILTDMPILIDIENDVLYKKGEHTTLVKVATRCINRVYLGVS